MYNYTMRTTSLKNKQVPREQRKRRAFNKVFSVNHEEEKAALITERGNPNTKTKKKRPLLKSDFISVAVPIAILKPALFGRISNHIPYVRPKQIEAFVVSTPSCAISGTEMSDLSNGVYEVFTYKVNENSCPPNPNSQDERERLGVKRYENVMTSTCAVFNGDLSIDSDLDHAVSGVKALIRMKKRMKECKKLATLAPQIQQTNPSIYSDFKERISITAFSLLEALTNPQVPSNIKAYTLG